MKLSLPIAAGLVGVAFVALGSRTKTEVALETPSAPATSKALWAIPTAQRELTEIPEATLNEVIQQYCVVCHSDANGAKPPAGLSLLQFDITKATENPVTAERMIRKLQAGMMPPRPMPRPGGDTLAVLIQTLERTMDNAARRSPNPGARPFQRLNRPEYEAAIRDLLAIDVDAGQWLPQDAMDANFDNVAQAQLMSPLLVESYLNAAGEISRLAIGDKNVTAYPTIYNNVLYISQHPWDHVPGAPYGTRGGMVVTHVFPADGEYVFKMAFQGGNQGFDEDVDISIDGQRLALLHYDANLETEPVFVRAGQHKVSVAFVKLAEGPYEDLLRPHEWALAGGGGGTNAVTHWSHLRTTTIVGPYDATGVSDSPSRQRVFTCRPTTTEDELDCARRIATDLGERAFRRPVTEQELDGILGFYKVGAEEGGFEKGVRFALEAILSHPSFYFRLEQAPANVQQGRDYRLEDKDLASRLSFFLWGTPPDAELLDLAERGKLSEKKVLEQQTMRMLEDPRADALGPRFAGQWFRLQDLYKMRPDPNFFTSFDENLADAMKTETELFFSNLVREDRSVLDLFTANYTFVNDRLARHYGFQNVSGTHFRKVEYPDDRRVGILGQGSVLVLTSLANRTSPVLRGKWVMEVLLGTPPPPPPPNVPALTETANASEGKILTTRERMEIHRAAALCRSCHQMMDPIGLALDNFDITGKWRYRESGMPLDTRGELYDGSPVSNPSELVQALVKRPVPLVRNFTENLMTYALGRRLEYYDQPTVRAIARQAEANDYRISSFVLGVVQSDAFAMRRAATVSENNSASGAGR
jgi:hypothetical protein